MVLPFQEFRKIKDSLPSGSIKKIADDLHLNEETVRNYFGATNYKKGTAPGVHFERGSNGGYVRVDNEEILKAACRILEDSHH